MPQTPRTVLIPAAGQGTRLLPLTKTTPKELQPVYDRPVLQFAIDEAVAAGATRIVIVIHPSKSVIRDYLRQTKVYDCGRAQTGQSNLVPLMAAADLPDHVEIVFAIQEKPLGLGHAIGCCRDLVLPGPVGVILPDDVILGQPCLAEMAANYRGGHMVAAIEVSPSEAHKYGIFRPSGPRHQRCIPVTGMVEKPTPGLAPSTLAAVGRYILDPVILSTAAKTQPGSGNEVQLTDAISHDARSIALTAYLFSGSRYDCGSLDGLLDAGIARRAMIQNSGIRSSGRLSAECLDGGRSLTDRRATSAFG